MIRLLTLLALLLLATTSQAAPLDFTSIRLGNDPQTALIVGGIQGDEPGGFSAASLLATRYEITKGAILVVPNLNFPSIIKRSRGLHGDMNRKFASLDDTDPEYGAVRRIQALISDPAVSLVLNLHDGSGYYRPRFQDKLKNPNRWGQSIIIDQTSLAPGAFMGDLLVQASQVAAHVNKNLLAPEHALHVRNTNTAAGDKEMEKSLSYYAARQNKAAFGLEASKELSVAERAFYHLGMIENFLKQAGIEFSRDFELTPKGVEKALSEYLGVCFAGNRVFLPLDNVRPSINRLPLPKDAQIITSKPIMAVLPCEKHKERLCVHYGNRMVAFIRPDWREINEDLDGVRIMADGQERLAAFGQTLAVQNSFSVLPVPGFRVNCIGYDKGHADETGRTLTRKDFDTSFSLDREGRIYRVEVYKEQSFAGMFLIRFQGGANPAPTPAMLPGARGQESSLGF